VGTNLGLLLSADRFDLQRRDAAFRPQRRAAGVS